MAKPINPDIINCCLESLSSTEKSISQHFNEFGKEITLDQLTRIREAYQILLSVQQEVLKGA